MLRLPRRQGGDSQSQCSSGELTNGTVCSLLSSTSSGIKITLPRVLASSRALPSYIFRCVPDRDRAHSSAGTSRIVLLTDFIRVRRLFVRSSVFFGVFSFPLLSHRFDLLSQDGKPLVCFALYDVGYSRVLGVAKLLDQTAQPFEPLVFANLHPLGWRVRDNVPSGTFRNPLLLGS